jgi:glucose/mannose transport system substrate-binding protein
VRSPVMASPPFFPCFRPAWQQRVQRIADGKAAFISLGDWTVAELVSLRLKAGQDFGWACFPGTDHVFVVIADGFTLAKGAPHPIEAVAWLKSVGSKEAQIAFNELKGSIPVRTDVDKSNFDPYHQWAMADFARDALVPSCVRGEAAPSAFVHALNADISLFVADKDVDRFTAALVHAAKNFWFGKMKQCGEHPPAQDPSRPRFPPAFCLFLFAFRERLVARVRLTQRNEG